MSPGRGTGPACCAATDPRVCTISESVHAGAATKSKCIRRAPRRSHVIVSLNATPSPLNGEKAGPSPRRSGLHCVDRKDGFGRAGGMRGEAVRTIHSSTHVKRGIFGLNQSLAPIALSSTAPCRCSLLLSILRSGKEKMLSDERILTTIFGFWAMGMGGSNEPSHPSPRPSPR